MDGREPINMNQDIRVGTVLIAKDECIIRGRKSFIIGEEYEVDKLDGNLLSVKSENSENHLFSVDDYKVEYYWGRYFESRDEIVGEHLTQILDSFKS